jgi:hypothetical protein
MMMKKEVTKMTIHKFFKIYRHLQISYQRRKHFQVLDFIMQDRSSGTLCIIYNTKTDHVLSINYTHLCVIPQKYLSIRIYLYHLHQILLLLTVFQKGILHSHLNVLRHSIYKSEEKNYTLLQTRGVGYRAGVQIQDFLVRVEERNSDIAYVKYSY